MKKQSACRLPAGHFHHKTLRNHLNTSVQRSFFRQHPPTKKPAHHPGARAFCIPTKGGVRNQSVAASASSSSGFLDDLANQPAATIPTSYSTHIGMASASCEITSGGVTTAATTKASTMK